MNHMIFIYFLAKEETTLSKTGIVMKRNIFSENLRYWHI